jgi:outer membrane protein OmpA-like peptidoglycan-associated protein
VGCLCLILAGAGIPAGTGQAQVQGSHLALEPYLGYVQWSPNVNLDNKLAYGGRIGFWPSAYVGLEGIYGFTRTKTTDGIRPWKDATTGSVDQDVHIYGGDVILRAVPSRPVSPFAFLGWQESRVQANSRWHSRTYLNGLQTGAGLFFRIQPRVAFRAEARDLLWKLDAPGMRNPSNGRSTNNLLYSLGLKFDLGGIVGVADDDQDGVSNKLDRCPGTPLGARVDSYGCPIDSDGDGVPDGIDQCADTPRGCGVDLRGCPSDTDGDGVCNGLDKCPDTAKGCTVDAQGCPIDSDGDNVCDGLDRCPNTATGCTVDAQGCPADADNDWVCDGLDRCPNTATGLVVDVTGCPIEVSSKETELLDTGTITTRDINFETAKWDLLPASRKVIDEIGAILVKWPELRIEIGGHTDSRGSDQYNLELSDKRANAVREYLLSKLPQVEPGQYTAKGYGESRPVASNDTVEGMALNRRVEFKVLNTEVLKKERERRQMLKKR